MKILCHLNHHSQYSILKDVVVVGIPMIYLVSEHTSKQIIYENVKNVFELYYLQLITIFMHKFFKQQFISIVNYFAFDDAIFIRRTTNNEYQHFFLYFHSEFLRQRGGDRPIANKSGFAFAMDIMIEY